MDRVLPIQVFDQEIKPKSFKAGFLCFINKRRYELWWVSPERNIYHYPNAIKADSEWDVRFIPEMTDNENYYWIPEEYSID